MNWDGNDDDDKPRKMTCAPLILYKTNVDTCDDENDVDDDVKNFLQLDNCAYGRASKIKEETKKKKTEKTHVTQNFDRIE